MGLGYRHKAEASSVRYNITNRPSYQAGKGGGAAPLLLNLRLQVRLFHFHTVGGVHALCLPYLSYAYWHMGLLTQLMTITLGLIVSLAFHYYCIVLDVYCIYHIVYSIFNKISLIIFSS